MFPWIVILSLLGILLMFAELLMPGFGLFGIVGITLLVGSTMLVAKLYGTIAFLVMFVALIIVFVILVIVARKSRFYHKVVLEDKQDTQDFDETRLVGLIGKKGITCTTLRPYGTAEFDGMQVDVTSFGDFVDRGQTVEVVQITGKSVTVKVVGS
ncbi:NfeD family protein [Chakrabartyella piscis]|uniref:NfeD family protein n=1 Tax=Chakrabartyella piscis TaxID=2918914 RepID=UPI00295867BC|nr:NfeD family protein [Chakrabartyella piscis]